MTAQQADGAVTQQADTLYDAAVAAGIPIDHHESDLYLVAGPVADALVAQYDAPFHNARRFRGTDGRLWWDVPFGYMPWWRARETGKPSAVVSYRPDGVEGVSRGR
jgi:hypothetical protein